MATWRDWAECWELEEPYGAFARALMGEYERSGGRHSGNTLGHLIELLQDAEAGYDMHPDGRILPEDQAAAARARCPVLPGLVRATWDALPQNAGTRMFLRDYLGDPLTPEATERRVRWGALRALARRINATEFDILLGPALAVREGWAPGDPMPAGAEDFPRILTHPDEMQSVRTAEEMAADLAEDAARADFPPAAAPALAAGLAALAAGEYLDAADHLSAAAEAVYEAMESVNPEPFKAA